MGCATFCCSSMRCRPSSMRQWRSAWVFCTKISGMKNRLALFFLVPGLVLGGCAPHARTLRANFPLPASHVPNAGYTDPSAESQKGLAYTLLLPPAMQPGNQYRLILAFHGAGENMENYAELWRSFAQKHQTIILVPQLNKSNLLYNPSQDGAPYFELLKTLQKE